jgi:hypothetical protein
LTDYKAAEAAWQLMYTWEVCKAKIGACRKNHWVFTYEHVPSMHIIYFNPLPIHIKSSLHSLTISILLFSLNIQERPKNGTFMASSISGIARLSFFHSLFPTGPPNKPAFDC